MKYVCVLSTNDYLDGVLVLNQNLKALKSKYKLLCLINENITEETIKYLDFFNIEYKKVKAINYQTEFHVHNWKNTFDKLNLFNLTEYKKIVYLDTDLIILDNIDKLFELDGLTMCSDMPYHDDKHNSGIMVIEPNQKDYEGLIKKTQEWDEKHIKNIGDQNIINDYFDNIKVLDENYNHMRYITKDKNLYYDICSDSFIFKYDVNIINRISKDPKIIHYIGLPKPFMINEPFEDENYPIYKKYLDEVRLKKNECLISNTKINVVIDSINYNIDIDNCLKNIKAQSHKNIQILLLTNEKRKPSKNVIIVNNSLELKRHIVEAKYTTIINKDIDMIKDCFKLCLYYLINYNLDWCQYSENDKFSRPFFHQISFHNEIMTSLHITKNFYDKIYKSELLLFASNIKEMMEMSNNVGIVGRKCYKKITK